MFFGTYTPKLDDKGRLFLPAKFRDQLAEGLVVTRGQERCLTVWSMDDFQKLYERLPRRRSPTRALATTSRMLFAAASNEVPDKQGRISIPSVLREYASLRKDVVVIGSMNRIEIWDPTAWTAYSEEQEQKFSDLSRRSLPRHLGAGTNSTRHDQQNMTPQDEVSCPLSRAIWGHLPRHQTALPIAGAGRDLATRRHTQHAPPSTSQQHHTRGVETMSNTWAVTRSAIVGHRASATRPGPWSP